MTEKEKVTNNMKHTHFTEECDMYTQDSKLDKILARITIILFALFILGITYLEKGNVIDSFIESF